MNGPSLKKQRETIEDKQGCNGQGQDDDAGKELKMSAFRVREVKSNKQPYGQLRGLPEPVNAIGGWLT
jgi:hypothetical protein